MLKVPSTEIPDAEVEAVLNLWKHMPRDRDGKQQLKTSIKNTLDSYKKDKNRQDTLFQFLKSLYSHYSKDIDADGFVRKALVEVLVENIIIDLYKEKFNCNVGLSDHSNSIYTSIGAVAMGASVIEKHFTIDRDLPGTDQGGSILPMELKEMVNAIKIVEQCMGIKNKDSIKIDNNVKKLFKHGLVAKNNIKKGIYVY